MYAFQTYDYLPSRGSGGFVRAASASKGLLYYEDSDGEVKRKIDTQIREMYIFTLGNFKYFLIV